MQLVHEDGLVVQGDGGQNQGGARAPEAQDRAGLLSFMRSRPMAETQVLANTLQACLKEPNLPSLP